MCALHDSMSARCNSNRTLRWQQCRREETMTMERPVLLLLLIGLTGLLAECATKDPLLMTEMDLEKLYDEWEENDEEKLPPDELPEHKRPKPRFTGDFQADLLKDPEKLMRASKKGHTVMSFVTIANNPSKEQTDELTQRWQVGLVNNHIKCERFVIADDRAIFVFKDGALAFEAKDFLLEQPELKEFNIDNRAWHGKGYPERPVMEQSESKKDEL